MRSSGYNPTFIFARMNERTKKNLPIAIGVVVCVSSWLFLFGVDLFAHFYNLSYTQAIYPYVQRPVEPATVDEQEYDQRMLSLAHLSEYPDVGTTAEPPLWPVTDAPYPLKGAIPPFKRIVAYYGNFYSRGMGILGEFSKEVVLDRLRGEIDKWEEADPDTPVQPAINYIAVTAQLSPGRDGKYRARMPHDQIDKALAYAEEIDGIVFLEVQPGLARLQTEIEALEKYLKMSQVHLAVDPEFVMRKSGARPGVRVGTVDAVDVNRAAEYLAGLVEEYDLPPKLLIVHRYTRPMVTNAEDIEPLPEVQIIMNMDGWGLPENKFGTYNAYVASEPVQFMGFKLFYKNDTKWAGSRLLTPKELLELKPQPIYIQYQ